MKAKCSPPEFRGVPNSSVSSEGGADARVARLHASVSLLVRKFLTGRLLFELPSILKFVRGSASRYRLLPGVLLLTIIAVVQAVASLGLGGLFFWCYPTAAPWLNEMTDLRWPVSTWGAVLGLLVTFFILLRSLHSATLSLQTSAGWSALVAGPAILMSGASAWLPSGDLWNAEAADLARIVAFGILSALVGISPQILALGTALIVCVVASALFWSRRPLRRWRGYAREIARWSNVPPLQQILLLPAGIAVGGIGALAIVIIAISLARRSSHLMDQLLSYAPTVLMGAFFSALAGAILLALVRGAIDRIRGVDGWVYAGANRGGLGPTFVAQSVARGAAKTVTGMVKFLAPVLGEWLPVAIGAIVLVSAIALFEVSWNAIGYSVWNALSTTVGEHRALYSELAIFAVLGGSFVVLSVIATRRMRRRTER